MSTPPLDSPSDSRFLQIKTIYYDSKWGIPLLTALFGTAVYFITAHRGLTWRFFGSDGGDLITAAMTNGIPHPTGYPTYLVLSRSFAYLPIGANIAHRFNLFSAFSMGVALFFLGLLIRTINREHMAGVYITLTFALTPLVWGQAIITEVYALNLAVLSAILYLLLAPYWPPLTEDAIKPQDEQEMRNRPSMIKLGLAAFLFGISLTTHLTSALFGLFFLLPFWRLFSTPISRRIQSIIGLKMIGMMALGFLAGYLPSFLIFSFRSPSSPVFWGDLSSWEGVWWLVSGEIYRPNIFGRSPSESILRVREWSRLLFSGWSWIAWGLPAYYLLISLGSAEIWKKGGSFFIIPLQLLVLALFFGLYALFYNSNDAIIFFLPGLLCATILCGYFLRIKEWYYLLLPICLLWLNLVPFFESDVQQVRENATTIFSQLPPSSIGLTDGTDRTIFTLWYYQHVEEMREDVILVDKNLFAFAWYRQNIKIQYPFLSGTEVDDLVAFRQSNLVIGPICDLSIDPVNVTCEAAR